MSSFNEGDVLRHHSSGVTAIVERVYTIDNREAYDGVSRRGDGTHWWSWEDGLVRADSAPGYWHVITDTPEGEQLWAEHCARKLTAQDIVV